MSDEEEEEEGRASSPDSGQLVLNENMSKPSSSAGRKGQSSSEVSSTETQDSNIQALRELLKKEEQKLSILKNMHHQQGHTPTSKPSSMVQGSALNKTSGRSSASGSGRNSPSLRASQQPKHSIVVVPGNQATSSASRVQASSSSSNSGISSRLQQLVDNIAVDQALSSCSEKLGGTGGGGGTAAGKSSKVMVNSAGPSKLVTVTTPPVPGLTSLSNSSAHKHNNFITSSNDRRLQLSSASNVPPLKPKVVTASTANRSSSSSSHEIITISDSPMGKNPPPLLSSTSGSATRVPTATANGSIHMPTISSGPARTTSSASAVTGMDRKNYSQAIENSRRYREYLLKQNHAKKNFQRQMERKMMAAAYPKTFRQVWPLIPVYDPNFVRNFGLEAVALHFDPAAKAQLEKNNNKVKPICNQCGCDFASAWQIRKSNSKQLLLCEACDFQNLKILQRSKLSNQLKEVMESVKTEEDKFAVECETARKHMVELEKQAADKPPPLTSQLTGQSKSVSPSSVQRAGHTVSTVTKNPLSKLHAVYNTTGGKPVPVVQPPHSKANGTHLVQQQTKKPVPAIPSILPQSTSSGGGGGGGRGEVGSKRAAPGSARTTGQGPPSKVFKPGSALDQTLNRLSKQLIERKLDEVVVVSVRGEVENTSGSREAVSPTSPLPAGQKTKSRRKGTPKHKRLLSASSVNSE